MLIKSEWKYEKADWDDLKGKFVNRRWSETYIKDLRNCF